MIEVIEYVHEYEEDGWEIPEGWVFSRDGNLKEDQKVYFKSLQRETYYAVSTKDETEDTRTGEKEVWGGNEWRINGTDLYVHSLENINGLIGLLEKVKARLEVSASAPVVGVSDE